AVRRAFAFVAGGERARHRQAELPQGFGEPIFGEAARALLALPEVAVAAHARGHAAAQVAAQHRVAERRVDEPRAAAPAGVDRARTRPPVVRIEPFGARLRQALGVEQNGPG